MGRSLQVLIVEDSSPDSELMLLELNRAGFDTRHERVETADAYRDQLANCSWDIVLSDYTMPGFCALDALEILRRSKLEIPFIVVTGTLDEETAVSCLKRGADDYILKENLVRLGPAVDQALKMYDQKREKRELEAKLLHAQRMETVGTLAGGIAHDFNNMLTSIFGYLDMAQDPELSRAEQTEYLGNVELAARQAAGITRALLAFSRTSETEKRIVSATEVCLATSRLVNRIMPDNITQIWDIASDEILVLGDQTQLQQVVMNLVVNACDAMPDGGTVTIKLQDVPRDEEMDRGSSHPGRYFYLSVADTGTGMSKEVRSRIFEPFFTTKPRDRGTGLGLSVVHGIVESHDGWIDVKSEPGKGSEFTVTMPRAEKEATVEDAATRENVLLPPETVILVVEDNDLVRAMITGYLQDIDLVVMQAGTCSEALEQARNHLGAVKIVLADLHLPDGKGLDVLDKIRADQPDIVGLLMTGDTDRRFDYRSTSYYVLNKPFTLQELRIALGRCLMTCIGEG